jgi:hypothetical protein
MNRNLKIYAHEAERSHVQEAIVASIWTFLLIAMFAASLLGEQQSKPIETAHSTAAASGSASH